MLLTRTPLYSWYCYHFLVRLACVRHAASVDSEPGSNSRLKPDAFPVDGGLPGMAVPLRCHPKTGALGTLPCEIDQAKPDRISRLARSTNCQRSLRVLRLGGTPGIEVRTRVRIVLELDAQHRFSPLPLRAPAFWREPFKPIKIEVTGQGNT